MAARVQGEVYRARDTKLKRDVALKVLPEAFASDTQRMARFEREAHLLASLNHPNIAAIYGLEQSNSLRFLVLELVPGDTLAERLRHGPLPVPEALELAAQIADAIASAHDTGVGVIHRDLKPPNIKITPDGQIKVLDFGLARLAEIEPHATGENASNSPTRLRQGSGEAGTLAGVVLGTAAYMSPEQARGRPVDKRTDIFSFGAVLYEMLTGRQLFKGEDAADTMASVMRSGPDFRALPAELDPRVRELLARCLEKDPKKRRRDIGDIRADLERPRERAIAETPERRPRSWLTAVGAALLVGATAIVTWNLKPEPPRPVQRFEMALPEGVSFSGQGRRIVALSSQGTHLVYAANDQLFVRALDQTENVPVRGTEGARAPFFSPDGEWIGFWADGHLKKVALTGGTPVTLCEAASPYGASWTVEDSVVFGQGLEGIWEVSANGGTPQLLIEGGEGFTHGPQKLPDGKTLLFTLGELANWNEATIVVERLDTGERKTLIRGGSDAYYVPTGHLVYAIEEGLFAVPFDLGTLEVMGGPAPVVERVQPAVFGTGAFQYSFSEVGSLAFVPGSARGERALVWVTRSGETSPITGRRGPFAKPRLSPDGKRLALSVEDENIGDVWILDIERDSLSQLTTGGHSRAPEWSPDGEWLVFSSAPEGDLDLFRVRSDFSTPPELLLTREGFQTGWWTPDGQALVFQDSFGSEADIWILPLEDNAEPRPVLETTFQESQPSLSPDGRFVAYQSTVSGDRRQIFIQPFPGPGGRRQISTDGGRSPRWSSSSGEIFFVDTAFRAMMVVEVQTDPEIEVGTPEILFERSIPLGGRDWDVTPDGERFVMVTGESPRQQINFVLNWFEELERLVPTR